MVLLDPKLQDNVSLLFLNDFRERYNKLIDSIGIYTSKYKILSSPFLPAHLREEKQRLIETIKSNFSPVLFQLEALAGDDKRVKQLINELKIIHSRIILSDEISITDLIKINEKLSKIVAILLIGPAIRTVVERNRRLLGDVEVEE